MIQIIHTVKPLQVLLMNVRNGKELTTASTNRNINGFSSVKPPATLSVIASSTWAQLKRLIYHIQKEKEEKRKSVSRE